MLLLVAAAHALPWTCPVISVPADGRQYVESALPAVGNYGQLYDEAFAAVDPACAWTEVVTEDWESTTTERACDDGTVSITWTLYTWSNEGTYGDTTRRESVVVDAPSGATWTWLSLASESSTSTGTSWGSSANEVSAAWTGTPADHVTDGYFLVARSDSSSTMAPSAESTGYRVESPMCTWSWGHEVNYDGYYEEWGVRTSTQTLTVRDDWLATCDGWVATLDGVATGLVLEDTWEPDPDDADRDGASGGTCDCDDADPARYEGATDIPYDGIDQDCSGADRTDVDADGYDALEVGGTDCDDTEADTNPGATEVPYDRTDQDCDGADLTDVDGDGEDAERAGGPDCDDNNAGIHTTASEVECDGIDQDCDGADECPPPIDTGEPAEEEPAPREEEEEEEPGCGGGAAGLALLPMLSLGRRKFRRGPPGGRGA